MPKLWPLSGFREGDSNDLQDGDLMVGITDAGPQMFLRHLGQWVPFSSLLQVRSQRGQVGGYAALDETGKVPSAQLPAGQGGSVTFGTIAGTACEGNDVRLSDARTPTSHTHEIVNTNGLQTALDSKAGTAALAGKADAVHGHVQGDVAGLGAALAAKADVGHGHAIGDVASLQATLDGKAAAAHGHLQNDVAGLVADLAGKQSLSEKGQANGYASLGPDGLVPSSQLPMAASSADPFLAKLRLASDVATGANVTPVNLTGLVFTFEANSTYVIEIFAITQAPAATTGSGFQLDVSVAVTTIALSFSHQLANTGTLTGGSSIADDAAVGVSTGRPSANVNTPVIGGGILVTGASPGTAQLRYRSEVAAVSTCKSGSVLRVMKVA